MGGKSFVSRFKDLHKDDLSIAGGKGANLGEMYNSGFPIPPGFVVTAHAYNTFLDRTGIRDEIKEILDKIDVNDSDQLQKGAKNIQTIIKAEEVPSDIKESVSAGYEAMYLGKYDYDLPEEAENLVSTQREPPYVAVRSSGTAEDLPSASFAGQQESFLNMKGTEDVVESVKKCWASLFTGRAIYYREKNDFSHFDVSIAVIVQKMINADKAGVAFSVDPMTEQPDKIVVEAAYGLADTVVAGEVNPDHYLIDKDDWSIVDKKVKTKDVLEKLDPKSGETKKISLTEPRSTSQVLSDNEIVRLSKIIKDVEDHYGAPQDIEWAMEGNKFYVVQARPITTLKREGIEGGQEPIGEPILEGLPASHGIVDGKVEVVESAEELDKVEHGEILVTEMTDPDFVPAMQRAGGIITDEGGITSHAAIVSREMAIPCIVGTEEATTTLKDGDEVTLDATEGTVYRGEKAEQVKEREEEESKEEATEEVTAEEVSKLKTSTNVYMNLGVPSKIEDYKDLPMDGIGLMRTEFIVASGIGEHPNHMIDQGRENEYVDAFAEGISKVAKAIYPKPVVVRFSDFKTNEYRDLEGGQDYEPQENNPMLGWRGSSRYVSSDFESAFRLECKAIKKVRDSGLTNVNVMLPFVRNKWEVEKVLSIMGSEGLERKSGFNIWIMAEVPSVAMMPEEFAKLPIDGASIGTNDLIQLVLGVDRDSQILSENYYDERNQAVLRAVKRIIDGFHEHGKTVSLCGQAPSTYPRFAEFLVRCGIDSMSLNPDAVVKTKKKIYDIEQDLKFKEISEE